MKKILIMAGGGTKHISPFLSAAGKLKSDVSVDIRSFKDLESYSVDGEQKVFVGGQDVAGYDLIYLRLVGRRFEDAALLVYYARKFGVKIIDSIFEREGLVRLPLAKSIEAKMLIDAGISFPRTFFVRTKRLKEVVVPELGYPFVIKGTTGKQGNAVWSPRDEAELDEFVERFTPLERKKGERFIAQEFIYSRQRIRVFVVGGRAVAAITRPMRWRKRFIEKVDGEYPEGIKENLDPVPEEDAKLAVDAAKAVGVDIGGADILTDDKTGKKYVIEVNSAPGWKSVKRDTGVEIEEEILKYFSSL